MWAIFDDKFILQEIEIIKKKIRENSFQTNELPKFIFICGKQLIDENGRLKSIEDLVSEQNKRYHLICELNKCKRKVGNCNEYNNIVCVIAEKLYETNSSIDLLTFEELLAELSDEIIIVVESQGTICELGAFALDKKLMKKLYVINDSNYENKDSFINAGPIRKIRNIDEEKATYIDYTFSEFKKDFRIKQHLKQLHDSNITIKPNIIETKIDLKNLIYELLNIIEIFQPLTKEELFHLYKQFKEFTGFDIKDAQLYKIKTYTHIINLLSKLELINVKNGFIYESQNITCYNALFKIDRNDLSKYRTIILNRMYKNHPERLVVLNNELDSINE